MLSCCFGAADVPSTRAAIIIDAPIDTPAAAVPLRPHPEEPRCPINGGATFPEQDPAAPPPCCPVSGIMSGVTTAGSKDEAFFLKHSRFQQSERQCEGSANALSSAQARPTASPYL